MKEKFTWIDVIIILLLILGVYLTIWYLFGDTPSELSLFSLVFTLLFTLIFRVEDRLSKVENKINTMENNIIEGFKKVREDLNQLKNAIK